MPSRRSRRKPCHQHVKGAGFDAAEEASGRPGEAQVLGPVGRRELELGPGRADVVERHRHRARGLVELVAAPLESRAHRLVALVHPRGEPCDARASYASSIAAIASARAAAEIALEQRVVVDGALGPIGEHRGGHAWQPAHRQRRAHRGRTPPRRRAASRFHGRTARRRSAWTCGVRWPPGRALDRRSGRHHRTGSRGDRA